MNESGIDSIEDALAEIRAGRMVIVTDDEDRENEGDLVAAADAITPEMVNFMTRYGRGLICTPLTERRAAELQLPEMVQRNREVQQTNFTVSVDAASGITTGISAADRARTIALLGSPASGADDLVQPGHVFPLIGKSGGVLRRAGHTEAAIDLARLAGRNPVGVICEILNEDGTMARLPELRAFAMQHGLKIICIRDLIDYRRRSERLVTRLEQIKMPTDYGAFDLYLYSNTLDDKEHMALVKGVIDPDVPALVRVHSECLTGDVFGSRRCDCGGQLHSALRQIDEAGCGVLLYMRQEGRGIGLRAKLHAYKLQEQGYDTVEANEKLGFKPDLRDYGIGAQILHDLGVRKIRLLTNNPRKVVGLEGHHLELVERVPIRLESNEHNDAYLRAKREKLGHLF